MLPLLEGHCSNFVVLALFLLQHEEAIVTEKQVLPELQHELQRCGARVASSGLELDAARAGVNRVNTQLESCQSMLDELSLQVSMISELCPYILSGTTCWYGSMYRMHCEEGMVTAIMLTECWQFEGYNTSVSLSCAAWPATRASVCQARAGANVSAAACSGHRAACQHGEAC